MATATKTRPSRLTPAAQAVKTAEALAPSPLGVLIDDMFELREKKRVLEEQIKVIEQEYAVQEEALLARMEQEATGQARGSKATASVTKSVVASITDRAALDAFVKKTGNFQLFQSRISDPAFRELLESRKGKPVPGLESFNKTRLNLRVLST